jgi:hypothetical protein
MWSTPMLKGRLIELVREMDVRPLGKNPRLTELAQWVIDELPRVAPDDPRTATPWRLLACGGTTSAAASN